jgi:hypothetical protein
MTPHALLTAIGATAIAFAVVIGASSNVATEGAPAATSTASGAAAGAAHTLGMAAPRRPGHGLASEVDAGADGRFAACTADCPIAV